jgi:circadian clock protein KaiC
MPEATVPEGHLYQILRHLDQYQPDHMVVDAISACKRMGTELTAFDFLLRLIYFSKQRNITCLMTNQVANNEFDMAATIDPNITSVVDTLVSLSFVDLNNRLQRDLVVVKSRGAHHSDQHHRYMIADRGIHLEAVKTG